MAPRYTNVIVFGPTGAVGRACALEASKRGAKVWLAMRDPSKTIDGIPDSDDNKYPRVKADITDPASVTAAVEKSGAKAVFIYIAFGAPGGIKPAVTALKAAGVEYVVLLSSFTIPEGGDLRSVAPADVIPFIHAQAELVLEDAGMAHTALRPGSFASNPIRMSMDTSKTPYEIDVFDEGGRKVDNIVPLDIGRVGGAVLVDRPSSDSKEIIYLYGPEMMTELASFEVIQKNYAKEVKLVKLNEEEWIEARRKKGTPEPLLKYFAKVLRDGNTRDWVSEDAQKRGAGNITKYSGYEPTTMEEYVKSEN